MAASPYLKELQTMPLASLGVAEALAGALQVARFVNSPS
jgi:hypothetical protein